MAFEIVLDDVKGFVDTVSILRNFFDVIAFHLTEEGIDLKAIDPSRVVLVNMRLPETIFARYQLDEEATLTVNMEKFYKALKLGKSGDTLILRGKDNQSLIVGFQGNETTFVTLPLLTEEVMGTDIPELEWTAKAVLLAGSLKRALTAAAFASDAVLIKATPDEISFHAKGENEQAETKLTMEDAGLMDLEATDVTQSGFGVAYLQDIVRKLGDDDEVVLRLGPQMPLFLKYSIRDEGEAKFLIAPRVIEE